MKKEDIQALFKNFEEAVCKVNETECWSARELSILLGYTQWRNFINVIDKAKESCKKRNCRITYTLNPFTRDANLSAAALFLSEASTAFDAASFIVFMLMFTTRDFD